MPNSQCSYEGDESIASIDKLLSKLPPPEKIIEPSARKALAQPDPAFKDPLVTEIVVALNMRNFQLAMGLSRKLTERYPRSAGAQALRGALAYDLRLYAEASAAFRTATTLIQNTLLPISDWLQLRRPRGSMRRRFLISSRCSSSSPTPRAHTMS